MAQFRSFLYDKLDGKPVELNKEIVQELEFRHLRNELALDSSRLEAPPKEVLIDNAKFFEWFGGVLHPRLRDEQGNPVRVLKPTKYQIEFADMDRGVILKTNKAGITTSESILGDFKTRLMPQYAGFDVLLVGQNQFMADQHLLDLKRAVLQSPTCSKYMITRPDRRFQLPEQKSKMREMYIENPYDPSRPSRIIAMGFSESLAYSWKNVNRLHISDPAMMARRDQTSFFSALYSRLSNTEGQIKIEGVAGQRKGYFWDLCKRLFHLTDNFDEMKNIEDPDAEIEAQIEENADIINSFKTMMLTADDVIKEGLITKEWLAYMRNILSESEFMRIYYCEFAKPEGAIFGNWKVGTHKPLGLDDL